MELLAGKVVLVPFDESTMVEGTVCPTTTSSPDAEVHGTLVAGLKKKDSNQNQQIDDKSTRLQLISHLPVANSLGGATMLPRH